MGNGFIIGSKMFDCLNINRKNASNLINSVLLLRH